MKSCILFYVFFSVCVAARRHPRGIVSTSVLLRPRLKKESIVLSYVEVIIQKMTYYRINQSYDNKAP
jgi:hypothetical protein